LAEGILKYLLEIDEKEDDKKRSRLKIFLKIWIFCTAHPLMETLEHKRLSNDHFYQKRMLF
jgi:hypothetical protein